MYCSRPIDIHVSTTGHSYLVPCSKCEECLQRKKLAFVHRCEQEKLNGNFKHCYFVTLTYKDEYLPYEYYTEKRKGKPVNPESTGEPVVCPYDLSMFFHRFRNFAEERIKYFACAEYGSERNTHRPHYHIILFTNLPWRECVNTANLAWSYLIAETPLQRKLRYKKARNLKRPVKRDSRSMVNRDSFGRVQVTSVTYKRICYVAKYVNKVLFSNEPIKPFFRISNGLGSCFLQTDTAKLCALQNRHFTYFQNGLPCPLSRYYSHKLFTAEQMTEFQLQMIRENDCPDKIFESGGFRIWWLQQMRKRRAKQVNTRLSSAGLLRYYG